MMEVSRDIVMCIGQVRCSCAYDVVVLAVAVTTSMFSV